MTRTYTCDFNRLDEDETDITVEYEFYPGSLATWESPACDAEVEIIKAYGDGGIEVELTREEHAKFHLWILENHETE